VLLLFLNKLSFKVTGG